MSLESDVERAEIFVNISLRRPIHQEWRGRTLNFYFTACESFTELGDALVWQQIVQIHVMGAVSPILAYIAATKLSMGKAIRNHSMKSISCEKLRSLSLFFSKLRMKCVAMG